LLAQAGVCGIISQRDLSMMIQHP